MPPGCLRFKAFSMHCVSHIQHGLWVRSATRQLAYPQLAPGREQAERLEKGRVEALCLADVSGVYDTYPGGPETSLADGMQSPVNDPAVRIPAMASVTEPLGFAFTSSMVQTHPFTLARQVSTRDHLSRGRIAWNIVTSSLPNAGASLGYGGLPAHDARYDHADEYLEVAYDKVAAVSLTGLQL